ncbi:hypothetical protein LPC08_08445 [Roseomonas sp. OT10]|uniref:DUF3592 domain-containing protein n=1 Tax=Roseomonas cutis TaxID=2897332 RepID=UPI001E4ACC05|nr:DUF3592 domain-containing protein [Roseomonas sp. OT10]UFN50630.1 hypothetical protein LPC08_08445 [Roseomonas sp. OT10]
MLICVLLSGLGTAATGVLALRAQGQLRAFLAASATAEGEVAGYRDRAGSPQQRSIHRTTKSRPVFRYRDAAGVEREAASAWSFAREDYPVGLRLPVRYDAAAHARAEADGLWALWSGVVALWGATALLAGLLAAVLRAAFRRGGPAGAA